MEKLHVYRGYTCDGCGRTFEGYGHKINGQEFCDECLYVYKDNFNQLEDFNKADQVFRAYTGNNEVTIDSSIDGEMLAKREAV